MNALIAIVAAVCGAAQGADWSGYEMRRKLAETELDALRQRAAALVARPDVPELLEAAKRVTVTGAEELPVYRILIETLVEERKLDRIVKPYAGGAVPAREVHDADPWKPALPEIRGWETQSWRLPVEKSVEVRICKPCGGKGANDCQPCKGKGMINCGGCAGTGNIPDPECKGTGLKPCPECGRGGTSKKENRCDWCRAVRPPCGNSVCRSGKLMCQTCNGLKILGCPPCQVKGKMSCGSCVGKGKISETLEILIVLNASKAEHTQTWLGEAWIKQVKAADGPWARQEMAGLEEAAGRIPEERLREFVLAQASAARAGGKDKVRGQRVSVQRVPVTLVKFELDGATYEAILSGGEFTADRPPLAQWIVDRMQGAQKALADAKFAEAREQASLALKADPKLGDAKVLLGEIVKAEADAKEREKAMTPAAGAPAGAAPQYEPSMNDMTCMLIFVCFVLIVVVPGFFVFRSMFSRGKGVGV